MRCDARLSRKAIAAAKIRGSAENIHIKLNMLTHISINAAPARLLLNGLKQRNKFDGFPSPVVVDFNHSWKQHMIPRVALTLHPDDHADIRCQRSGICVECPSVAMHENARRRAGQ